MQLIQKLSGIKDFTDEELNLLKAVINEDELEADLIRRIKWVIDEKVRHAREMLLAEWQPKLEAENAMLPTSKSELLNMVFTSPSFKPKKQKDIDSVANKPK